MAPLPNHLVVFAREARLGTVKSRLARDIGTVGAWQFYRTNLAATLHRLDGDGRWYRWLAITPDRAATGRWPMEWPLGWTARPQGDGTLGERMHRVMRSLPPGPTVIVGTDVPDLNADHAAAAFRALGSHDAVFGPAPDGGYWLVGLARRPRLAEIFANVRWSGPHALADTLANTQGLSVALLETLEDIDTGADLQRYRSIAAPKTKR